MMEQDNDPKAEKQNLPLSGSEETKILKQPSQSSNLKPIDLSWQDLKQAVLVKKPSSVVEFKQSGQNVICFNH